MKPSPTKEQEAWLSDQMAKVTTPERINPCVGMFGKGPDGFTCKGCTHIYRCGRRGKYIKCDLRPHTNGPGSDHRVGWPACAKYEGVNL